MKRILCLFLIFSLLPLILVYASDDSAGTKYNDEYLSDCIKLISATDTGIAFGTDYQAKTTRADFLIKVMKLVNVSPKQNNEYTFIDVDPQSELSQYLDAAINLGIISKSTSFNPEQPIKYAEAFKIMVVALGYAIEAEASGGYPTGYMSSAIKVGITQNLDNFDSSEAVCVGSEIVMLRNFCETPIRVQTKFGDTNAYIVHEDKNILTEYFSMYKISGVIDGNERTGLYEVNELKDGCITIDSVTYLCNLDYSLGYGVEGYAVKSAGIDKVVYLSTKNTHTLTIPHDAIISSKEGCLIYDNGTKEVTAKLENPVAYILNGKAFNTYTYKDFIKATGTLTLIDNNDDKTYDVAIWEVPEIMYIDKISKSSQAIFDTNTAKSISLSDSEPEYELFFNGNPAVFSDIIGGSVAQVYYSADKTYLKLDISSKNITGVFNGIDNTNQTIYIGDTEYKYSKYFETHYLNAAAMGESYTFVLSSAGEICANYEPPNAMRFAYLLKVAETTGLQKDVMVMLYSDKGEIETYNLADKVNLNEDSCGYVTQNYVYNFFKDGENTKEQMIRFSTNSDNKIDVIDTEAQQAGYSDNNANPRDNLTRFSFTGDDSSSKDIVFKGNKLFIPSFTLSSTCVIFNIIDDPSLDPKYRCSNTIDFTNDTKLAGECLRPFNVSDSGAADAFLYINKDAAVSGTKLPSEPSNGLVSSFRHIIDEEGMEVYELGVCTPSSAFEYYKITDNTVTSNITPGKNGALISPGDYVRFSANAKKEITLIEKDFDVTTMSVVHTATSHNAVLRYYFAKPYSADGSAFSFVPITNYFGYTDMSGERFVLRPGETAVKFNLKTKTVTPATMDDIITYSQSNELCSNILIRTRYAIMTNVVIYE